MPRRKRIKLPPRIALPASELESKMMAMLRGLKECARLKGVGFVHVGSFGQEPNWFARPLPTRISEACRRAFVTALAKVRKEFDTAHRTTTVAPALVSRGAFGNRGNAHVFRHNPDHNPHSCADRRHLDMGPQPSLGIWAFRNCRPYPDHSGHIGSAGQL
jgi:hypothetical protein